ATESRATESRATGSRATESRATESRATGSRATGSYMTVSNATGSNRPTLRRHVLYSGLSYELTGAAIEGWAPRPLLAETAFQRAMDRELQRPPARERDSTCPDFGQSDLPVSFS